MNQLAQATLKALNNCEDKQQFMLLYTLSIIENTANDTSRKDRVKNAIEQSKKMSEAAKARHNDSDHARAKAEIKQKWLKDRESIIARHGGKAKFYDDMQKQYQIKGVDENGKEIDVNLIRDLKTIQGWVAKWEKELL
jgi:pantothenate kinase